MDRCKDRPQAAPHPRAAPRPRTAARPLTLFAEAGGVYRLCPGALNSYRWRQRDGGGPPVPTAEYIAAVRQRLDPRRLRDCGYAGGAAGVSDEAVAAAVTGGIVTNPAFLDIVDGLLARAPCLCCYSTRSRARAAEAEGQILLLAGYYAQASYEASTAFYRVLGSLLRDISPAEAAAVRRFHARGGGGEEGPTERAAREGASALSRLPGVCAVHLAHPPARRASAAAAGGPAEAGLLAGGGVALCVYSTPEGRKALRGLGKACKARGLTLTTQVATGASYGFFCLRHKLRLYALECHPAPGGAGRPPPTLEAFWGSVAAAARRPRPRPAGGGSPPKKGAPGPRGERPAGSRAPWAPVA